jgi:hypothetical protein
MKIKSITEKIELHFENNILRLISEGNVLLEGFTDIGVYSNGLIPIIYFNEKRFIYVDDDTLKIYEINNVDWISGFHYVGNDLNYMGHNYRTDPTKKTTDFYKFKTVEGVKNIFEKFDGCETTVKTERKFDFDLQKMVETGKVEITCALIPQLSQKLFNEIKYYRIVGRGVLSKGLDMGTQPVKLDDGNKYNPLSFTLSQKNDLYGVVDVRTNKLLLETKYKKIDILPNAIIVDSGEIINY